MFGELLVLRRLLFKVWGV